MDSRFNRIRETIVPIADHVMKRLNPNTRERIRGIFDSLDYSALGEIYCDEGGAAFWTERRRPAEELGTQFAEVLLERLPLKGRSLYVGAGVAEIPALVMEVLELKRQVMPTNLRDREVSVLNRACQGLPFAFVAQDAGTTQGRFDHLWMVSVLNDPECFPELGALSSGQANPVTFDADAFSVERRAVTALATACLDKLERPGLVTTSVEEIPWITHWCERNRVTCVVEDEDYPTAIVGDPLCFIRIDEGKAP